MAVTSSIANLFSFFAPSPSAPPPRSPPSQLSLPSSTAAGTNTDRWAPLISSNETRPQSSLSCSSSSEITSVICPSLAYSNTLFFGSAYNVQIVVDDDGEPEEGLVDRFRREVMRAGVIQECKRRRFFENKQEERKRRKREEAKRNRRRRFGPPENSEEDSSDKKKKDDDDEDNWDLPEGDLLLV